VIWQRNPLNSKIKRISMFAWEVELKVYDEAGKIIDY
jgi:hypothetical protein